MSYNRKQGDKQRKPYKGNKRDYGPETYKLKPESRQQIKQQLRKAA